jgi:preprotein translocase subunit YajC
MHVLTILAQDDGGGGIASLAIFLLIPLAMYFLLIRPQRRRQRETAALQAAIGVGDEVMTHSGMYGFITGFDGDIVWLEIDDNIQVRVARAAIQRKVDTSGAAPDESDVVKDADDADSTEESADGDAAAK